MIVRRRRRILDNKQSQVQSAKFEYEHISTNCNENVQRDEKDEIVSNTIEKFKIVEIPESNLFLQRRMLLVSMVNLNLIE